MRAVARDEGRVKKRLAQFVGGKDWIMRGLQMPDIHEYPGSLLVARPTPAVTDLVKPSTTTVFFVGKLHSSEPVNSIWIAREFVQLLLYGHTKSSCAIHKCEQRLQKTALSANKATVSLSPDGSTRLGRPSIDFALDRPTIVVVRCALKLSGRCRCVNMYRLPLVFDMLRGSVDHVPASVKERVVKRCESLVEWMQNVQDALTCTAAKELPAAPEALMDEIDHHGETVKEKVESLSTLATPPLDHASKQYKCLVYLKRRFDDMDEAERTKLYTIPWFGAFKQECEDRKRFRALSRKEQIAVVIASLRKNPVFKYNYEMKNERVEVVNGQTIRFLLGTFRYRAVMDCVDAVPPEYEELAEVDPDFKRSLNKLRFTTLSKEIGHEQTFNFYVDALVEAFPSETYNGGPRIGSTLTVVLRSADGLKTASKTQCATSIVYRMQETNWLPTARCLRPAENTSDRDWERRTTKKYTATHAQKQRLLLIPWFKFNLEALARQHDLQIDTALDADHQYLIEDGVKLRASKLASLLSRVDWKPTLSASQQYMVFFGNHAEVWSRFDWQYGKGLKEKLRSFLKQEPAGRKLAGEIAQSIGMSVDKMWSTHEIDHVWIQANRDDVADCVGNFAMCPRVLNNCDEFKHDGCEKHHYYGQSTWKQVQMLFQFHDKWINNPSNQHRQFNPNKVRDNVGYTIEQPTRTAAQTRKITDFFNTEAAK